mmetsp:Transcript_17331/g.50577  ORF Transcript_17331/g.50577 Transcript_17331/m.50577 type:complete len:235 (-) Transcript_17331:175-879(-)
MAVSTGGIEGASAGLASSPAAAPVPPPFFSVCSLAFFAGAASPSPPAAASASRLRFMISAKESTLTWEGPLPLADGGKLPWGLYPTAGRATATRAFPCPSARRSMTAAPPFSATAFADLRLKICLASVLASPTTRLGTGFLGGAASITRGAMGGAAGGRLPEKRPPPRPRPGAILPPPPRGTPRPPRPPRPRPPSTMPWRVARLADTFRFRPLKGLPSILVMAAVRDASCSNSK